ncbi:MAG: WYL domain-containing protein [Fibrobacteraceae bacterium]
MTEATKIKVFVSPLVRSQLEMDVVDYGLRGMGELCNRIIGHFQDFKPIAEATDSSIIDKNCPPLQFSLHKKNHTFADYAESAHMKLATLCRHYFEEYVNLPRGKRECFLQQELLRKIQEAIDTKKNMILNYRDAFLQASPCFIAFSPSWIRAYLVVCEDPSKSKEPFHALRLSQLMGTVLRESIAFHTTSFVLSQQAELFKEHFDPFLCYGKEVSVRLNEAGIQLLRLAVTNRPKFDPAKVQDDIYRFECSEKLAQIYFPQFLENAEILSPPMLREWFQRHFQSASEQYKKKKV